GLAPPSVGVLGAAEPCDQRLPLGRGQAQPPPQDQAQRRGLRLVIGVGGPEPLEALFQRRFPLPAHVGGGGGGQRQQGQRGERFGRRADRPELVGQLPRAVLALVAKDGGEQFLQAVLRALGVPRLDAQGQQQRRLVQVGLFLLGDGPGRNVLG